MKYPHGMSHESAALCCVRSASLYLRIKGNYWRNNCNIYIYIYIYTRTHTHTHTHTHTYIYCLSLCTQLLVCFLLFSPVNISEYTASMVGFLVNNEFWT